MGRPTFDQIYMRLAFSLAQRSMCKRLRVGCVITSTDYRQVYAVGYNGQAAGVSHTWEENCCSGQEGSCGCLHGEDNAIINCQAPRDAPKFVYVTHFPCRLCAIRLINLGGVNTIFYVHEYRGMNSSLELLDRVEIAVERIELNEGAQI